MGKESDAKSPFVEGSMIVRLPAEKDTKKSRRFSLRSLLNRPNSYRSVRVLRSNLEFQEGASGGRPLSSTTKNFNNSSSTHILSSEKQSTSDSSECGGATVALAGKQRCKERESEADECPLCLQQLPREKFPNIITCHHRSCIDCLRQYLRIEISESRTAIACPECSERFHPTDIQVILDDEGLMQKYEEFMVRRVLVADPDARWCPAPDCRYAVIASDCASCPKLKCERWGCGTNFCYHCKQRWHPNQTCDAARAERTSNVCSASVTYSIDSGLPKDDVKTCPRCGAFIVKMDDGSCNHMTCAVCGSEFCWLCMKEISDLHYLSPSGCTFWGKKPWSRKKKKVPTATLR